MVDDSQKSGAGFTFSGALWKRGIGTVPLSSANEFIAAFDEHEGLYLGHMRAFETRPSREFLLNDLKFHPLAVEDALCQHERPGLQESPDSLFLEATAIRPGEAEDQYSQVSFFLGKDYLVTVCIDDFPVAELLRDRWQDHPDEFGESPAYLLHSLLDEIVDDYFPATDSIQSRVEELEERIYGGERTAVQEVMRIKRRLLEMRRRLTPIRDVINTLLRRDVTLVPHDAKPYFQDVYDHVLRLTELIDLNRDILATVLDAQLSITSNRLNEVMRSMTVLATLLMTGALVAGVYGMNFDFMPELHWKFGYPFAVGLMIFLSVIELILFKWKKYI